MNDYYLENIESAKKTNAKTKGNEKEFNVITSF